MDVDRLNRPINLLPDSKRNKTIIRLSLYSYRDNYVRRSYNADLTKTPPINKNKYKGVRYEPKAGITET
jgi:hypothetical protein